MTLKKTNWCWDHFKASSLHAHCNEQRCLWSVSAQRQALVVDDVTKFPGYISCDAAARSELVIPLIKDQQLLGVLDLDAPVEKI